MKLKLTAALAATVIVITGLSQQAEARHYRHHHSTVTHGLASIVCNQQGCNDGTVRRVDIDHVAETIVGGRPSGCPHAFCGCGTSIHVFGRIIPELNLAANWRRFPPAAPARGMVAWRWGHVFVIEDVRGDGSVLAYDPNSGGHRTHVHVVSLRGYHVVNPHGEKLARN